MRYINFNESMKSTQIKNAITDITTTIEIVLTIRTHFYCKINNNDLKID